MKRTIATLREKLDAPSLAALTAKAGHIGLVDLSDEPNGSSR